MIDSFPIATDTPYEAVMQRIRAAEIKYDRPPGSITLLAVGKTQPLHLLRALYESGVRHFGESYLQEALPKLAALRDCEITWHFIGAVQSNKTRPIAEHFDWVHGVDRLKIAERLNEQRPAHLPPLNVCIQANVGDEPQKAGIGLIELPALIARATMLPRLRVRGLMALPPPSENSEQQRHSFRQVRLTYEQLRAQGYPLDTLSMGMSADLEAAIAEGTTMVRIGAALFGERPRAP